MLELNGSNIQDFYSHITEKHSPLHYHLSTYSAISSVFIYKVDEVRTPGTGQCVWLFNNPVHTVCRGDNASLLRPEPRPCGQSKIWTEILEVCHLLQESNNTSHWVLLGKFKFMFERCSVLDTHDPSIPLVYIHQPSVSKKFTLCLFWLCPIQSFALVPHHLMMILPPVEMLVLEAPWHMQMLTHLPFKFVTIKHQKVHFFV